MHIGILLTFFQLFAASQPELSSEAKKLPSGTEIAVVNLAKGGSVEIRLFADTPITSGNFSRLAQDGFFDNLTFHRLVPGFVVQGGDPFGQGYGEPGYFLPEEPDGKHKAIRGMVSMARKGSNTPNTYGRTSGSQFFIMLGDAPKLDPNFCFFGEVIKGMDIVDGIKQGDVIKSIVIVKNGK